MALLHEGTCCVRCATPTRAAHASAQDRPRPRVPPIQARANVRSWLRMPRVLPSSRAAAHGTSGTSTGTRLTATHLTSSVSLDLQGAPRQGKRCRSRQRASRCQASRASSQHPKTGSTALQATRSLRPGPPLPVLPRQHPPSLRTCYAVPQAECRTVQRATCKIHLRWNDGAVARSARSNALTGFRQRRCVGCVGEQASRRAGKEPGCHRCCRAQAHALRVE